MVGCFVLPPLLERMEHPITFLEHIQMIVIVFLTEIGDSTSQHCIASVDANGAPGLAAKQVCQKVFKRWSASVSQGATAYIR